MKEDLKMASVSNEELVRKAVIVSGDLATSGKLNPKQADRFLDYIIDESVLKNNARIIKFRNEQLDIDKLSLGTRAAVPKAEAVDPGVRRGLTTSQVTLKPQTIMVPFEIGDEFKEINIEGEAVKDHLMKMFGRQLANDTEELALNGDTNGHAVLESVYVDGGDATKYVKDSYLGLFNGWGRLGDGGNAYDAQGASIGLGVFGGMLRKMPTKFRRDKRNLRFFMSSDLAQLYIEKLATRATMLGDKSAEGAAHTPYGVSIVEVPLFDFLPPIVEHVTLTATTVAALRYGPISSVVVTTSTLGTTPESAYTETTDYIIDYTAGTIVRSGAGSAITSGQTVKVTYKANPQILLTHMNNFILGIGRDLRLETDRSIYKGVDQVAITMKLAVEFEEDTAIVKGSNIATTI